MSAGTVARARHGEMDGWAALVSDTRLAAARALARGVVRPDEEPVLAALDPGLWRVARYFRRAGAGLGR